MSNLAPISLAGSPRPLVPQRRPAPVPSLLHRPTVVLLGRDDSGKPHASWFDEAQQKQATHAATVMGMQALSVANDEIRQLADRLPQGRVFASGRAFVPFVKATLFDELAAHLPEGALPVPAQGDRPARTAATASAAKRTASQSGDAPSNDDGPNDETTNEGHRPEDWSKIAVGSVVLATEGPDHGWYESVVETEQEPGLFLLRWRDWPDLPRFARKRNELGLLPHAL